MVEPYLRQHALAHRGLLDHAHPAEDAGLRVWLEPHRTALALRADPDSSAIHRAVTSIIGAALPLSANRASRGGDVDVLWMGPDEWLLVGPEDRTLAQRLEQALSGEHFLLSDVSSARLILGLSGPNAVDTLRKGCSLDLHPRVFPEGHVSQITLARAHAILHHVDARPGFHLYVHRSFADYVFGWLLDAGAEYGIAVGAEAAGGS